MKHPAMDCTRYVWTWLQAMFFSVLFSNMAWLPYAYAGPEGDTATSGSGTISQSGNQTTIQ